MTATARWLPAGLALLLGGLVLESGWVVGLAMLLLVTGSLAWAWARLALVGVRYDRRLSADHAFAGESVELTLRLANEKPLPLAWVRVADGVPAELDFGALPLGASARPRRRTLVHLAALRPYERLTWRHGVVCPERGHFTLGPARLVSGDLFGLYEVERELAPPLRLVVYPRVRPLAELGFPAGEPLLGRRAAAVLVADPLRPVGVREYRPEDPRRHVHWKATARLGQLQVRVPETVSQAAVLLVLNAATFPQPWMGVDPVRQEQAILVAASIARHAVGHRQAIGLAANGVEPGSGRALRVPLGRSPAALRRVLAALAAVGAFVTVPIEQLVTSESRRAPLGATLVVVTPIVGPALLGQLTRLRRAGRRTVLVSLDPAFREDPPGLRVFHLDPDGLDLAPQVGSV